MSARRPWLTAATAVVWLCTRAPIAGAHAPAEAGTNEPAAEDPVIAEARQLYDAGLADYETFEYDGAIEKWTRAYAKLGDSPGTGEMRNAIVYNIARAREKAYEQTRDITHLKKAAALLERYVADEVAAGEPDEADLAKARADVDELRARIAELERAAAEQRRPAPTKPADGDVDRPAKPGRSLVITGGVLTAVGLGLVVGGITAGAVVGQRADDDIPMLDELGDEDERRERIEDGRRANLVMLGCGIAGGVVAVTGIALLAVGATKPRRAARAATLVPAAGPGFVGTSLVGRF
jgi:hypothetical protein